MAGRQTDKIGVTVNSYRGFKIWYDEDDDKFYTDLNDNAYTDRSRMVKRQGLKAIRQEINDHIKKNLDFKPFEILFGNDFIKKKVVSIRKDGAILVEKKKGEWGGRDWVKVKEVDGELVPASDWYKLFQYNDDAEKIIANIAILEAEKDILDKKVKEWKKKFKPLDLSFIKPYIIEKNEDEP